MNNLQNVGQTQVGGFTDVNSQPGTGLEINPAYKGSLSPAHLEEIQGKYSKYLKLEQKTGIPWKVIAALDVAGGRMVTAGWAADGLKKKCVENGVTMTPSTSRSELMDMLNKAKANPQTTPDDIKLLDLAKVYYDEIGSAFVES